MNHPHHRQVFEQLTSLLEVHDLNIKDTNPSTGTQNHRPVSQQTPLDILIDTTMEESRRTKTLERNRLTSLRCREKKKSEEQQMVERANNLAQQNESLNMIVGDLRKEFLSLRELLLTHDTCDCDRVQSFLKRYSSAL